MNLSFDPVILRPLIEQVVLDVLRLDDQHKQSSRRLAYSEAEAAELLGTKRHVLRDARLRGELTACRVGKRIHYERNELIRYLERQRGL